MKRIAFLAALAAALTLPPPAVAADWAWPVRGDVVTPYRNGDDPYASGQHRGIDIAAPVGARVASAAAGRVTFVGTPGDSGLTVSVRTADGRFDLSYLHLAAAAVREGDSVGDGDAIGAVGTSGRRSVDQPHLHFGVREAGERHAYRDPLEFLPPLAPPARDVRPTPAPVAAPEPAAAPPAAAPVVGVPDVQAVGQALAASATAAVPGATPAASGAPAATSVPERPASAVDRTAKPAVGRGAGPAERVTAADVVATPARDPAREPRLAEPGRARPRHPAGATGSPDPGAGPRGAAGDPRGGGLSTGRPAAAGRTAGLDFGWLTALAGLIAAALCLGRPEHAGRVARRGRATAGAVLRPLTGRA